MLLRLFVVGLCAALLAVACADSTATPTPDPVLEINEYGGVGDEPYGPHEARGPYRYDPPSAEEFREAVDAWLECVGSKSNGGISN